MHYNTTLPHHLSMGDMNVLLILKYTQYRKHCYYKKKVDLYICIVYSLHSLHFFVIRTSNDCIQSQRMFTMGCKFLIEFKSEQLIPDKPTYCSAIYVALTYNSYVQSSMMHKRFDNI